MLRKICCGKANVSTLSATAFAQHIEAVLDRKPLLITGGEHPIKKIAWCTGGARDFIDQAAALGVDAFISGEASGAFHSAIEQEISISFTARDTMQQNAMAFKL